MASTTIDPSIYFKPSDKFVSAAKYLHESDTREKSIDSSNILPNGISNLLTCSNKNNLKPVELTLEDIKWMYARKKLLKLSQNKSRENENIDWIRSVSIKYYSNRDPLNS